VVTQIFQQGDLEGTVVLELDEPQKSPDPEDTHTWVSSIWVNWRKLEWYE